MAVKINKSLNEKEQEEAVNQTQLYLAENYSDLNYEIQTIDSSTDFKHYGYYEHAVTVENTETKEKFEVFYDKKMKRMEDSIKLKEMEALDVDHANVIVDYWTRALSFNKEF